MDIIESVIETYEMRTGNAGSANAALVALAQLRSQLTQAQEAVESAMKLFEAKEWLSTDSGLISRLQCRYCRGTYPKHEKECKLSAWLAEVKK